MKRRDFILLSGTGLAAMSAGLTGCEKNAQAEAALATPLQLGSTIPENALAEIGNAYLEMFPDESSKDKLLQLLAEPLDEAAPPDSLRASVIRNITADFASGNTVVVKGWVISRTEARQCALFTLTSPKHAS